MEQKFVVMETICLESKLEKLAVFEHLSVRSYHVCIYGELLTLKDILLYFQAHKNFLLLRSCGVISNDELIRIANKYHFLLDEMYASLTSSVNANIKEVDRSIVELNKLQRDILAMLYEKEISMLSATNMAFFRAYFLNDFSLENVYSRFVTNADFTTHLAFYQRFIQSDLDRFRLRLVNITNRIVAIKRPSEIFAFYITLYLDYVAAIPRKELEEILQMGDADGKIPIFKIVDKLIELGCLFNNKRNSLVFKHTLNYWRNTPLKDLTEVGLLCNLTRERVRQLRNSLNKKLDSIFNFLTLLDVNYLNLYTIDKTSDLIFVDESLCMLINASEKTNFNEVFIAKILAILLKDTHILVSNESKVVVSYRASDRYSRVYAFLVSRQIATNVDVDALAYDLYMRQFASDNKLRHLVFEKYIPKYLRKKNAIDANRLKDVVSGILSNVIDSNRAGGGIVMNRNLSDHLV